MRKLKKLKKKQKMKNPMQKNKFLVQCPACEGSKKVKNVKTIIQIGKFYLGKEIMEECKLCSEKALKQVFELDGDTLH